MSVSKKRPAKKKTTPTAVDAVEGSGKEFGKVSSETLQTLNAMRSRVTGLLIESGKLELRRQDFLNEARRLEAASQTLLKDEAESLGIPEGQAWQITPEGTALIQA